MGPLVGAVIPVAPNALPRAEATPPMAEARDARGRHRCESLSPVLWGQVLWGQMHGARLRTMSELHQDTPAAGFGPGSGLQRLPPSRFPVLRRALGVPPAPSPFPGPELISIVCFKNLD